MNRLRGERGGILVIAAVVLPVFLLLCGLVVDTGDWFTHKRQLQNRADAGALAAGVEYLSQLAACRTDPANAGAAIADAAKQYAGDPADPGTTYNQEITNDNDIVVGINRANFSDADGNPCDVHADPDWISPAGSIWTDVKVRESNIGTIFGAFGLNLPSITARARVQVNQLTGIRHGGLPFVNETGDQVDCAWAQFVDVDNPGTPVSLVGTSNPIVPLSRPDPTNKPRYWTADVGGIKLVTGTTDSDDIGVRYWLGTRQSGVGCAYDPTDSSAKAAVSPKTGYLDYINVYSGLDLPGPGDPPIVQGFKLTRGTCGGPGYLYTPSIDANATCTVNVTANVYPGVGPDKITVSSSNPNVGSVDLTPGTPVSGYTPYNGTLTFKPNQVDPGDTTYLQDYTQVGPHQLTVTWRKNSGKIGNKNCPCTGAFADATQATYVADPINSSPIMDAELTNGSGTPIANSYAHDVIGGVPAFTIELTTYGIDQQRTFLIRDSVQNTGNRSKAVDCGQGTPNEPGLADAIRNGCKDPLQINTRNDVCTTPWPNGIRDCVETVPGTKQSTASAYMDRFLCSYPNNWVAGSSPANLKDSDPRYAYIILTSWGRIVNAKTQGEELPIRAFLRVYVTGWDRYKGGKPGPESCGGENEPPPKNYDDGSPSGAVLWGHFVDIITLNDDVIISDLPCDTTKDVLTCKPVLVR